MMSTMIDIIRPLWVGWNRNGNWDWDPSFFANPDMVKVASTLEQKNSEERGYQSTRINLIGRETEMLSDLRKKIYAMRVIKG